MVGILRRLDSIASDRADNPNGVIDTARDAAAEIRMLRTAVRQALSNLETAGSMVADAECMREGAIEKLNLTRKGN
jgi:hypothetical protein